MGSSIARAARKAGIADTIVLQSRHASTIERARVLDLGDVYTESPAQAVVDAELVIVAVPVGAYGEVGCLIGPNLKRGAVLSDVGSVKGSVVREMNPHVPKSVDFIPAHPIAGMERTGPDAGKADLFVDRWCVLTPLPGTALAPLSILNNFWTALGARTTTMTPEWHDRVLAMTSHLPHLLAFNIMQTAIAFECVSRDEVMKFSSGGFRDVTRIAASDPTMWRDIFLHNKDAVLEMLGRFREDLRNLEAAIRWEEGDILRDSFEAASVTRRSAFEWNAVPSLSHASDIAARPSKPLAFAMSHEFNDIKAALPGFQEGDVDR